jgi:hypothetical protein
MKGKSKPAPPFEPRHLSVYIGRRHLGTFVQTDTKCFEAFAACGRSIGVFTSRVATLAAINKVTKAARSEKLP